MDYFSNFIIESLFVRIVNFYNFSAHINVALNTIIVHRGLMLSLTILSDLNAKKESK